MIKDALWLVLAAAAAVLWSNLAFAIDAASPSFADVSSAVAATARNGTVNVPAGSANWGTNTLELTQGIKLLGAGRDSTFITGTNRGDATSIIHIHPDTYARQHADEFRIEGFTFDGSGVSGGSTSNALIYGDMEFGVQVVIGRNRFRETNWNSRALNFRGQTRGLIYQNLFDRCNGLVGVFGLDTMSEWANPYFPFAFGSSDNLYFEANTITWSSSYIGSFPGWCESGQGSRIVYRYNHWDFNNAEAGSADAHYRTTIEIIDAHGFQGWGSSNNHSGETGTMVVEVYGNTIVNCAANRFIVHRGGWGMFFNNILSGGGLFGISAQQYQNVPGVGGGGCQSEVAGYDWVAYNAANPGITIPLPPSWNFKTQINNTYTFNNLLNGVPKGMGAGAYFGCGIAEGVDFFNDVPMFPGNSSQISKGSETPTASAINGYGYWKASDPTPVTDASVIQAGHLYKRVGGAWVDYYKPYTYPHPLRSSVLQPPGRGSFILKAPRSDG